VLCCVVLCVLCCVVASCCVYLLHHTTHTQHFSQSWLYYHSHSQSNPSDHSPSNPHLNPQEKTYTSQEVKGGKGKGACSEEKRDKGEKERGKQRRWEKRQEENRGESR